MSFQEFLFIVFGALSVGAAVAMLLTKNAVYSALFLIVNFACVAFFYLMLDAPFLAMVQIAVYAGAIMVLFLFVIMLLDADRDVEDENREFRWLPVVTLVLAMSFLFATGLAFFQGQIDSDEVPDSLPMLRVVNAAPILPEVDVYANGELIAEGVRYSNAPEQNSVDFLTLAPGDYEISLGGENPILVEPFPVGSITVEPGMNQTLVMYGATTVLGEGVDQVGLPELTVISEDLTDVRDDMGRITVVNAYNDAGAISVIDVGSDFLISGDEEIRTIVEEIPVGAASEPLEIRDGEPHFAFVPVDNPDSFLRTLQDFSVEEDVTYLTILTSRVVDTDGTLQPSLVTVATSAMPAFGSPEAIGESLFIDYVLPFEIVAVLLLAAMVGAIVLTQRPEIKPKPGRPMRRRVSRPLTSVISSQTGTDVRTTPQRDVPQLEAPDDEQPEPAGD